MIKVTDKKDTKKVYIFEGTGLEWIMGHMIDLLYRAHNAEVEPWVESARKGLDLLTGALMGHKVARGEYTVDVEQLDHDDQ